MDQVLARLESATKRLEALSHGQGAAVSSAQGDAPTSAVLVDFDEILSTGLVEFIANSTSIGGLVEIQSRLVAEAFQAQRGIIQCASTSKKPDQASTLQELIKPLQEAISRVVAVKDKNRSSPFFNHLACVAEGIPTLGWVVVEPAPAPYALEMKEASQFYVNRVIKEFKGKDETQIAWANSYVTLLGLLHGYVKKLHTTGLTWNSKGGDARSFAPSAPSQSAPVPIKAATSASPYIDSPRPTQSPRPGAALASAIAGSDLTAALRKVDKAEMTHKNPELRASGIVKGTDKPTPNPSKLGTSAPKGPPKTQLEGNKWCIENHHDVANPILIENPEIRHVVYIFGCSNSTIQIKGKVNTVTLDNCKKVGLVVDNAMATIDIVNCKSCQLQITGKVPTVLIDKTDGLQLYLSRDSLNTEILTAKSSEMNVVFEDPKIAPGTADFVERAISEQFKTKIVDGELVTVSVEHQG